ncbi:hypothetical protein NDN08_008144 [Rhodosorus marinus]|uniref:GTPase Der n=1 Tax=Rhodosorus marinus TaxID=101924 RepID=A0AAV8V3H9_9RHOD|nr:hypothetical protein NDN08_008144 [Rhodosorus marinus]
MTTGGAGFVSNIGFTTRLVSGNICRRTAGGGKSVRSWAVERDAKQELGKPDVEFDIGDFGGLEEGWTLEEDLPEEGTVSEPKQRLPMVAVIGRPNVGKSMIVNRLSESYRGGSIVHDLVGTTRDRTYRRAFWADKEFFVVDTGGLIFEDDPNQVFLKEIRQQALIALEEAAAVIFVTDGQQGVNPLDEQIAVFLRKECKVPVYLAVNKCESDNGEFMAAEFWTLGMGQPFAVSGIHGTGTGDLMDEVCFNLPKVVDPVEDTAINVSIIGKPNVGKSTLLNRLVQSDRAIVSNIPGTTRDSVDEMVENDGKLYRLIDTAGIRRKRGIEYGTEFFMINRAFNAIRRSDVSLLLVDGTEDMSDQDGKIAERVVDEGRGCVIICNKWDAIEDKDNSSWKKMNDYVRESLPQLTWAPIVVASALTGQRTANVFKEVDNAVEQHRRRVSTAVLNEVLYEAVSWHKPPATKAGRQGKIYYCTQVSVRPPTIAMFVNDPSLFRENYRRYMEGQFRKALGFAGTPIRVVWRGKSRAPIL